MNFPTRIQRAAHTLWHDYPVPITACAMALTTAVLVSSYYRHKIVQIQSQVSPLPPPIRSPQKGSRRLAQTPNAGTYELDLIARLNFRCRRFKQAELALKESLDIEKTAAGLAQLGVVYHYWGKPGLAIRTTQKALADFPGDPDLLEVHELVNGSQT